jgi:hypothetical protein
MSEAPVQYVPTTRKTSAKASVRRTALTKKCQPAGWPPPWLPRWKDNLYRDCLCLAAGASLRMSQSDLRTTSTEKWQARDNLLYCEFLVYLDNLLWARFRIILVHIVPLLWTCELSMYKRSLAGTHSLRGPGFMSRLLKLYKVCIYTDMTKYLPLCGCDEKIQWFGGMFSPNILTTGETGPRCRPSSQPPFFYYPFLVFFSLSVTLHTSCTLYSIQYTTSFTALANCLYRNWAPFLGTEDDGKSTEMQRDGAK